jgi:hypothetical protein
MRVETSNTFHEALSGRLKKRGFSHLGPGADRHGSWEWVFLKAAEGLNRFVFVSCTDVAQFVTGDLPWYRVQVWAGADDHIRFVRRLTGELRANEQHLGKELPGMLSETLDRAMTEAERFRGVDLTEIYLPARTKR